MKEFHKLVRNNIPKIIEANGDVAHFRVISDNDEFLEALLKKDIEEGIELAQDPNIEELADKLEVLYAIGKVQGFSPEDIERARAEKAAKRGGFGQRIFLEYTD